jgi:Xaa-Pro aminopeptidase
MRYEKIPKTLFIKNRERFAQKIRPGSLAFFTSNETMPTNRDGVMGFIQNSNLFYFSGIDQEDTHLLIGKPINSEQVEEILFIRETNETIKIWEGDKLSMHKANDNSGIARIHWSKDFWLQLEQISKNYNRFLFYDDTASQTELSFISRETEFQKQIKKRFPHYKYQKTNSIVDALREIKQPEEIKLVKQAIEITRKAFENIAVILRPQIQEYEIEAEISYVFLCNKSRRHAFQPIVASGKNACVLHYVENKKQCLENELVLIDFGAEYGNYNADMTRTLPVNGFFTPRQKEIYDAVLRVLVATKSRMIPGNTLENLNKEAKTFMGQELINVGLITAEQLKDDPKIVSTYFPHSVSHFLGLDVHDVGNKKHKFEPGMLLTCEPGIYIKEENIGIRLENDILITEDGHLDLMAHIPITSEEIENLLDQ